MYKDKRWEEGVCVCFVAYTNSFFPCAIVISNMLPQELVNLDDENVFKQKILDFVCLKFYILHF